MGRERDLGEIREGKWGGLYGKLGEPKYKENGGKGCELKE